MVAYKIVFFNEEDVLEAIANCKDCRRREDWDIPSHCTFVYKNSSDANDIEHPFFIPFALYMRGYTQAQLEQIIETCVNRGIPVMPLWPSPLS